VRSESLHLSARDLDDARPCLAVLPIMAPTEWPGTCEFDGNGELLDAGPCVGACGGGRGMRVMVARISGRRRVCP